MKTFKVKISITGLNGTTAREHDIKASTEISAIKKAYLIIGNQSGSIKSINGKAV